MMSRNIKISAPMSRPDYLEIKVTGNAFLHADKRDWLDFKVTEWKIKADHRFNSLHSVAGHVFLSDHILSIQI